MRAFVLAGIALALAACAESAEEQQQAAVEQPSATMAELAVDPQQKQLWEQAAQRGDESVLSEALVAGGAVTVREPVRVDDTRLEARPQPFPLDLATAFALVEVSPTLPMTYDGDVRVVTVDEEFLTLELDKDQRLIAQAKVRGGTLNATEGETARLLWRQGDPFARDDVFALATEQDVFGRALVGGDSPVRVDLPPLGLVAAQTDQPAGNVMPVDVTVAGETQRLQPGEEAQFDQAGVTVRVVASVAVQGEAANALPGRPYRLELLGWRTRDG